MDTAHHSAARGTRLVVVVLVVGLLLALTAGYGVARLITRRLSRVGDVLTHGLAKGDLTMLAGISARDEIGDIGRAADNATLGVRSLVAQLSESAQALGAVTHELTEVSKDVTASASAASAQAGVVSTAAGQVSQLFELEGDASLMRRR